MRASASILIFVSILLAYSSIATSHPSILSPHASMPIVAMAFDRDAGPKSCRGNLITAVALAQPASQHANGTCYDMQPPAQCGVFIADKADACEARLYSMEGCPEEPKELYITTAAFSADDTAVGGLWRSMLVRCAVDIDEKGLAAEQAKLQDVFGGYVKENGKGGR